MVRPNEPSATSKWMSYLSDNVLLDVEDPNAGGPYFWQGNEQVDCSAEVNNAKPETPDEVGDAEGLGPKKRYREECLKDPSGKANREKQRRDRLNDRFMELSQTLDPGRPPKTDKATILCDAVRVIGQLRAESQQLKDGNVQLRDQIKELKSEKNELRDEKARLKAEKEKLEQQLKALSAPAGYMPHPAAMQAAAAAAYAAQAQAQSAIVASKGSVSIPAYPGMPPMWHWMPANSVDTSQDHIRHPPVA